MTAIDEVLYREHLPPRPTSPLLERPTVPPPPRLADAGDVRTVQRRIEQLCRIVFDHDIREPWARHRKELRAFARTAHEVDLDVVSYFVWAVNWWIEARARRGAVPRMATTARLLDLQHLEKVRVWMTLPEYAVFPQIPAHQDLCRRWAALQRAVRADYLHNGAVDARRTATRVSTIFRGGWQSSYAAVRARYAALGTQLQVQVAQGAWVWDFWGDGQLTLAAATENLANDPRAR